MSNVSIPPSRINVIRRGSIELIAALVLGVAPSAAQQPLTGTRVILSGTVTDASGSVLAGATIDAVVSGRVVASAVTGPDGRYQMAIAPGPAQLRVHLEGFSEQTAEISIAAGLTRDFTLAVAPVVDTVVVTASRRPEARSGTIGSIAVLTGTDIAAMGSTSIADVVRSVPGLNVESNGREGAVASLFSRGGESDYNLVLIDGVRVNASGGAFDFSRVSAAEIDRVEIVRGAQSALYGSDAIGSVVQIFTRRETSRDVSEVSGSIEGGSFQSFRGDVHVAGGSQGRVDYHAGISRRNTRGAFSDELPEPDRFGQTAFNGGIGTWIGDRALLRTGLRYSRASGRGIGPIAYGSRDTGTAADTRDLSGHIDFSQRLTPRLSQSGIFTYFQSYRLSADRVADPSYNVFAILAGTPGARWPESPRLVRLIDEASFKAIQAGSQPLAAGQFLATTPFGVGDFPFASETKFRRTAVKYQANLTWHDDQMLIGGYEYERETDPLNPTFRIESHAYFAQQQLTFRNRWFVTAGSRLDDNTRYGTNISPKLSAGGFLLPYRSGPLSSVKVFSTIGRGIKNPTFGELYGSAFTDGNPELHPERARTVEAGAELTVDSQRWLGRVTYFHNRYRDQVAFKSTGFGLDGQPDFLNIDGSRSTGWEIEGGLQRALGGVTATGGYAFVDSEVVSSVSTSEQFQPGQPLLRRPRHSAMLRVAYLRGRAGVHVNLRHTGDRHDAAFLGLFAVPSARFPEGRSVDITVNPAYTVTALAGTIRVTRAATLFVRIDNLTDARYESALGYPGLPRSVVVGSRFTAGRR